MKDVIPEELKARLKAAKKLVQQETGTIRIVSHYDADGICAAGILCNALERKGLIDVRHGQIVLLEPEELERLIAGEL